jgi:hypothetical protein
MRGRIGEGFDGQDASEAGAAEPVEEGSQLRRGAN